MKNILNLQTMVFLVLLGFLCVLSKSMVFPNSANATGILSITFEGDNSPAVEPKTVYYRSNSTSSSLPRITATLRYSGNTYGYRSTYKVNEGVSYFGTDNSGNKTTTTPYGTWRLATGGNCGNQNYHCPDIYFDPSVSGLTGLSIGSTTTITLTISSFDNAPTVSARIVFIMEDINMSLRAGSTGMETNRTDDFDRFNFHYWNIRAVFANVSELSFELRIKEGGNATLTFNMGRRGQEWYSEGKYGSWTVGTFGTCSDDPSLKCSRIEFRPNRTTFNRTYGQNVRIWVTGTNTRANKSQAATIEFNLTGRVRTNLEWDTEGAGNLRTGNLTSYSNIVGKGFIFKHWERAISFQATEKVNAQATEVIGNRTNTIESNKRQFGSNLTYGSWWVDEQRSNRSTDPINNDYFTAERGFFFKPNSDAIVNNLEIGQTVTSTLKFRLHTGNDASTAVDKIDTITVTITRLPVVTITVDNATIKEGGNFTYTLTANPAPTPTNSLSVQIEETDVVRYADGSNIRNIRNPTKILTRETFFTTKTTELRDTVFPNGTYIIRIKSDENYVIKDGGIVTITVENVAPSEISISTNTTSITEGESFEVTLTASPVPLAILPVTLSADDSESGFFDSFSTSPVEIPITGSAQVTISTNSLATRDMMETLEISIDTASSYVVSSSTGSISVNVEDNNMHTISITSPEHDDTIVEGAGFSFTLTATPPPTVNLVVTLDVETTPTGYLGDNFRPTIVIDTSGVFRLTVATDRLQRFDKVVRVIIGIADKPTLYATSSEESSITVSVAKLGESELSRVSITSNADGVSVIEGQPFTLSLIAEPAPDSELEVMLMVPTSNLFDHASINSIMIPVTGTIKIPVMTNKLLNSGESEEILIYIENSSNYFISATASQITTTIIDEPGDRTPTVSVHAARPSIPMGQFASFNLLADPVPTNAITVNLSVSYVGNTVLWRGPTKIQLQGKHTLSLNTLIDWGNLNAPHSVTVRIESGTGYKINDSGDDNARTIVESIGSSTPSPLDLPNVAVASSVANSILALMSESDQPTSSAPTIPETASADARFNENYTKPILSIFAKSPIIQEGEAAEFEITSIYGSETSAISVRLRVIPVGDFFGFSEPKQISVPLPTQSSVPVIFPTIDDTIAEADGRLEVSIIPDSIYLIATNNRATSMIISDATDRQDRQDLLAVSTQAFLPDVVGNMAARTSDLISQRVQMNLNESSNVVFNLDGESSLVEVIEMSGEMLNEGSVSWHEVLGDSNFALTLLSGDEFAVPTTIWGIGDYRDLSSTRPNGSQAWSGAVFTRQYGIDTLINQELLTGLSASITENEIEVGSGNTEKLEFVLNSTSLNPYINWTSPTQDTELRAVAGYGIGDFTIDQANYDVEVLSSKSYSLSLAGSKELYSSESLLNGTTKLQLIGDSWIARQNIDGKSELLSALQTDAQFLRISTEATHQFEFERGSSLTPLISTGIRRDQKDQQSLFGLELSGGFDYTNPIGFTLSGSGSMLLTSQNEIQKMSLMGSVEYDYGRDDLGLKFALSPTWVQTQAELQNSLWSNEILARSNEVGQYTEGTQISSEIGYGFALGEESRQLNLYSGYEFDAQSDDELLLGTRLAIGSKLGLDFERINKISTTDSPAGKYQFNVSLSW